MNSKTPRAGRFTKVLPAGFYYAHVREGYTVGVDGAKIKPKTGKSLIGRHSGKSKIFGRNDAIYWACREAQRDGHNVSVYESDGEAPPVEIAVSIAELAKVNPV